jgi:ABC-type multidrug transport system permease subunit
MDTISALVMQRYREMPNAMIGWQGIVLRFLFAAVLVFSTYNPDGCSYYHWFTANMSELLNHVPIIFVGIVLLVGWTIFLRATIRSLGPFGLFLAGAFFGTLIWLIVDMGWVPADSVRAITYIVLVTLCAVLATGVSWSHIRRRISGQIDTNETDE